MGSRTLNGFSSSSLASLTLLKPYNLSDLESPTAARINLGLTGNLTVNSPYLSISTPFNCTSDSILTINASTITTPGQLVAYNESGNISANEMFAHFYNTNNDYRINNVRFVWMEEEFTNISTSFIQSAQEFGNIKFSSPLEATGEGIIDYITFASPIAGLNGWLQIASVLESATGNIEINSPLEGFEQNPIQFASPLASFDVSGNLEFASPIASTTGVLVVDSSLSLSNKLTIVPDPPVSISKTYSLNSYIGNFIIKNESTNANVLTIDGSTNDVFVNGHIDCYTKYYFVGGILVAPPPITVAGNITTWFTYSSSNMSIVDGVITITKPGLYTISASTGEFRNTTATSGFATVSIIADILGSTFLTLAKCQFTYSPSITNAQSQVMSVACIPLNIGDTVFVQVSNLSGGSITLTAGQDWFSCRLIT